VGSIKQFKFDHPVELFLMADIHLGDDLCDRELFAKLIDRIKANDHAYVLGIGDLLNTALKNSKSSVYESTSVQKELDMLCDYLSPIKGKILSTVASNHHQRMRTETGLCLDKVIADRLGIPFDGNIGRLNITCGRLSHYVCTHHGVGGGSQDGGKVNSSQKLLDANPGFNIAVTAHTHTYFTMSSRQLYLDKKRNLMTPLNQVRIGCGHLLLYDNCYAERMLLREKPRGIAVVSLPFNICGNEHLKKYIVRLEGE
jgi:hypothetical protein